jgi:hypothetical protein
MKFVSGKKGLSVKKFFRRYLIIPLIFVTFIFGIFTTYDIALAEFPNCPISPNEEKTINTIKNVRIESIAADQSSLQLQCNLPKISDPITISVNKPELKATLQGFSSGDNVNLTYTSENDLTGLSVAKPVINCIEVFLALIITGLLLYVISFLIVKFAACKKSLNEIFVGQDNRLSNSKSQMAVWFFVLLVGYISLSYLRVKHGGLGFVGGIGIPENLLLLSGLSALTYGGAKVITQSQVNSKPNSKPISDKGKLTDFVTDDDGNIDFGDLQMSFITLLAVVVYLLQLINFLSVLELHRLVTLPDVDTTILSIFGISQGAYLAKKAAVATGAKEPLPLKIGSEGEKVEDLKKKLKLTDDTNKVFNDNTENEVKSFQKKNGLDETGIVDSKTSEKLGLYTKLST